MLQHLSASASDSEVCISPPESRKYNKTQYLAIFESYTQYVKKNASLFLKNLLDMPVWDKYDS